MRIQWKRFFVCIAIQSAVSVGAFFARGLASAQGAKAVLMCLSDGFFLGGALMLVAAGLSWTFGQGVGDGLSYSVGRFFTRRGPGYEEHRRESYYEYKERKHAKKTRVLEMLLAGILFVLVALALLLPYTSL